jgi:hypothetical protein
MNLEIKHLRFYPETLQIVWEGVQCGFEGIDFNHKSIILERVNVSLTDVKPILRPMEDLRNEEFEMDEWRKNALMFLDETANLPYNSRDSHIGSIMFGDITKLFQWHFDVFGLIKAGLAIDINTLNK